MEDDGNNIKQYTLERDLSTSRGLESEKLEFRRLHSGSENTKQNKGDFSGFGKLQLAKASDFGGWGENGKDP